ncbi:hypothetical protein [Desulfitobacterium chlororespirans]|uniref:Uncharacterized protein n=1 Tax=Desulfitobacterium chlororespirans DSM 11544 TaxID=1121395 RepID=A0A1M7T4K3_9FIRM|nr:hypothetical protein [Desulfitobacterium chlororespirans]SHN65673.1 hypothetical protein SAMN02745215_01551 [Desulfitobacterium chlororespirans DSM 11544]
MNQREIASIGCKLIGIFFVVQGARLLSFNVPVAANMIADYTLTNIVYSLITILFGILLWCFSGKLAKILVKEKNRNEAVGIGASDLQRIGFSVLGLYFIGHSLPELVTKLASLHTSNHGLPGLPGLRIYFLGGTITELLIGIGIFLGSQGLVNLLNLIRTAGLKRDSDSELEE